MTVVLRQHDGVGIIGKKVADNIEFIGRLRFLDQAVEQNVIGGIGIHAVGLEGEIAFRVVLYVGDVDIFYPAFLDRLLDRAFVCCALGEGGHVAGHVRFSVTTSASSGQDV